MKIFLTVRGNLLLINLTVISLILWLAISFLHIAVAQRSEAMLLQDSMSVERLISQSSDTLANERRSFDEFLKPANQDFTQLSEKLKYVVLDTDASLDRMAAQISGLADQAGFIEKIPASLWSIQEQLSLLERHRDQLAKQRSDAFALDSSTDKARGRVIIERLLDGQTRIQKNLVSLAKSLKYLPDRDAASIVIYHTLLDEILITSVDLARKNSAVGHVISGSYATTPLTAIQVAVLSEKIEQKIADMVRLSLASDKSDQLHPVALKVQNYYLQEYQKTKRRIEFTDTQPGFTAVTMNEWQFVTSELSRLISELADEAHESLEVLVNKSASRASRNLVIDILLVGLCFVIALASVAINRRIKRYAYHDSLTHLANRMNFESTLRETRMSDSQSCAVIFIDLDRFKSINDNYGHAVGDELLIEVAARLKSICRASDLLARLGGDEFAVLLPDIQSGADAEKLAHLMVEAIECVITIRNLNLKVGASAGISVAPHDCAVGVELLRNADIAMYHSKSNNLSNVFRFKPELAIVYQQRLILEQDLKKGIENREFHLVYQPKICTRTGEVKSVEALLRWSHSARGLVSPVEFIPVAEEMGLMGSIGFWVLEEACREIALLQKSALSNMQVAVNISAQQFGDENFLERVYGALEAHHLTHSCLSLEVTESIVMTDVDRVIRMLRTLQNSGVDIAVDDFGTGYSSLQYLQELPLNTLKIDRAFITALDDADPSCSVANSIVQLATLFNLETVAEGVETDEQDMKVRSLGVHHIQGYRYSRPVPADELPAVIMALHEEYRSSGRDTYHHAA